eukprot:gene11738-1939_t
MRNFAPGNSGQQRTDAQRPTWPMELEPLEETLSEMHRPTPPGDAGPERDFTELAQDRDPSPGSSQDVTAQKDRRRQET